MQKYNPSNPFSKNLEPQYVGTGLLYWGKKIENEWEARNREGKMVEQDIFTNKRRNVTIGKQRRKVGDNGWLGKLWWNKLLCWGKRERKEEKWRERGRKGEENKDWIQKKSLNTIPRTEHLIQHFSTCCVSRCNQHFIHALLSVSYTLNPIEAFSVSLLTQCTTRAAVSQGRPHFQRSRQQELFCHSVQSLPRKRKTITKEIKQVKNRKQYQFIITIN